MHISLRVVQPRVKVYSRFPAVSQMPPLQATTPKLVTSLMDTQSMDMPQTLLAPPSSHVGIQQALLLA